MKELRLSLKTKWFNMTKAGIKIEEYREINDYWCRRLLYIEDDMEFDVWCEMINDLNNQQRKYKDIDDCMNFFGVYFRKYDVNVMTLGYPKSTDLKRILKLEHKGIEIRTGNTDLGAEPNKLYFVIKHGKTLNN